MDWLLFSKFAVIVVLSTSWLTYTVIPIYAAMKAIDGRLFESAVDLGAGWFTTFRRVLLPLAAPGIFVALILVYIPLFSEFATPALVGGRSGYMLGSLANSLILEQGDWGAGAALNFLLLAASALVALLAYYLSKLNTLETLEPDRMRDLTISTIDAREVLDCRGLPTVQVDLRLADGTLGRADVPSGRSTGSNEACELRDGGTRLGGFGVLGAVANVSSQIAPALRGASVASQRELDAPADRAGRHRGQVAARRQRPAGRLAGRRAGRRGRAPAKPLYRHLNGNGHVLPVPLINLINGGRHASNDLDFQEFIIMPVGAESLLHALQIGTEVNLKLADILLDRFGKVALNPATPVASPRPCRAPRRRSGSCTRPSARRVRRAIVYGLDCAATHLYDAASGTYTRGRRALRPGGPDRALPGLISRFGIVTIEDPLTEEDFEGFAELTEASGIQIVGDDLFVTNPRRLAQGVAAGSANSLLWKVNQIGTLSEALDAAELAHRSGYTVFVSERSGETEDPIIADLVVALNAGQIKTGAPVRGERTAKYNRLIQIEEELGSTAAYAGRSVVRSPRVAA